MPEVSEIVALGFWVLAIIGLFIWSRSGSDDDDDDSYGDFVA